MAAILNITDDTTPISLLETPGIQLDEWRPQIPFYKGDGTYQSSPLASGRQLVNKQFENAIENMAIKSSNGSQDSLIYDMQEIRRLLEKAADYWSTDWQNEPVWIEAKADCETNTRYAHIVTARIPEDQNPYEQPFGQVGTEESVMNNLNLIIEHLPWSDTKPTQSTCLPLSVVECYPQVTPLLFDGASGEVDCGTPAGLDDLPDFAVAGKGFIWIDGYVKSESTGQGGFGRIAVKGTSWQLFVSSAGLRGLIDCAAQDADSRSGADEFDATDNTWHYVAMCYDETGGSTPAARTIYLNVDGIWITSYTTQQVSIGNYVSDAASDMIIGSVVGGGSTFDGNIGWFRVRDALPSGVTVNVDFTPPARCPRPDVDANTQGQYVWEGEGNTTGNEGAAGGSGTITTATWDSDEACCVSYGNYTPCSPSYGEFNGSSSNVNCGSNAVLDDLPDNAVAGKGVIVYDLWFRTSYAFRQYLGDKTNWWLRMDGNIGYEGQINCAGASANSRDFRGDSADDGTWHHLLMVYDETGGITPAARKIYFAEDGIWATSYSQQTTSAGNYTTDAASNLLIGSDIAAGFEFNGDIGWARLRDALPSGVTVNINFTSPARCTLPTPDANTVGLWNFQSVSTWHQFAPTAADNGSATDVQEGCDCVSTVDIGRDPTCNDEVYTALKGNKAALTHIFVNDGGTFGPNLLNSSLPYALLPPVPANNDAIYFGIDTSLADSGPFYSLVFDLGIAQSNITDIIWEYWQNLAMNWQPLTVQDNTDADGAMTGEPFDTLGVNSVHWEYPSNWDEVDLNTAAGGPAITGFWIRARVVTAGANQVAPVQQNRHVYTITQPYIETQTND